MEVEAVEEAPEVQTFDEFVAGKVHEHLCEIFSMEERRVQTTDLLNGKPVCVVDDVHRCLVEARTTEAKVAMWPFIHPQTGRRDPISLVMSGGWARFRAYYLMLATRLLSASGEHIGVQTSAKFPLVLWNEHFRIVIAPTINEEYEPEDERWGAYPLQNDQEGSS